MHNGERQWDSLAGLWTAVLASFELLQGHCFERVALSSSEP